MVSLIAQAAEGANEPVNVFDRFDLMRRRHEMAGISFDLTVDPTDRDRLLRQQPHAPQVRLYGKSVSVIQGSRAEG
jgi:hypothetical protein